MRPLYDRYRAIKRVCNISSKENSHLQREDVADLADTLATVTLLPSGHVQVSWVECYEDRIGGGGGGNWIERAS